jgi:transposase
MEQLEQQMADLLRPNEGQVQRLAEVPGLGLDSAQQILTEVGATAATFPSEKHLASWVGACPGNEESAEVNYSRRSPQGNHHMRRILNQTANAAVKLKGSIFEIPGSPAGSRNLARCPKSQLMGNAFFRPIRLGWSQCR